MRRWRTWASCSTPSQPSSNTTTPATRHHSTSSPSSGFLKIVKRIGRGCSFLFFLFIYLFFCLVSFYLFGEINSCMKIKKKYCYFYYYYYFHQVHGWSGVAYLPCAGSCWGSPAAGGGRGVRSALLNPPGSPYLRPHPPAASHYTPRW